LHDADSKTITTKKGEVQANPAWKANEQILEVVSNAPHKSTTLVASLPNFEEAMFGEPAKGEKPYGAWEKVRKNPVVRKKVSELLSFLAKSGTALPDGVLCWSSIDELEQAANAVES
jgi:putative ATP-dependent endonuclease of OLD family